MTAHRQKKQLSDASLGSPWGHCRAKRKKLKVSQFGLCMRSNITLQWDDGKKSVRAKREQIGLSWRDLKSFIVSVPGCHNVLADVFTVPGEIFQLENLTEVLSYEVWETYLSGVEKNILTQFLPKGAEEQEVVRKLLGGENFHFGNSFLKWGASLCSGNLHPDAVLRGEQCFKANKKAYFFELQKYHHDMIGNLLAWKERWSNCKDPEKEIVQTVWRRATAPRSRDPEENFAATSESCSLATDEGACSSDQNVLLKCGELQRGKCIMDDKYDNLSDGIDVVARPKKGEKLQKRNIQCGDGAKYMSYIKVSKDQHQRVKSSMKHSRNSIQSRSLNRVLGSLDTFHVRPFEVFEEEERQKLHDYWSQLVNRDIPAAFANWRGRRSQKWQFMVSLEQEMEIKLKHLKQDAVNEKFHGMLQVQLDYGAQVYENFTGMQDEEKERSASLLQGQTRGVLNVEPATALEDEVGNLDGDLQEQMDIGAKGVPTIKDANNSRPFSNQHLEQSTCLTGRRESCPMDLDSDHNHVILKPEDAPGEVSENQDNVSHLKVSISQGCPLSSASDVWPTASVLESNIPSTCLKHEYSSASKLLIGHPAAIEGQQARLINLESNIGEAGEGLLHRNNGSFFSSYPSEGRSGLPQHLFKGHGGLTCHLEQKETGIDFQPANNVSKETGQFFGNFQEQLHPPVLLEPSQKRLNDLYMHQKVQESMYTNGSIYSDPRQHIASVNVRDWTANAAQISAPIQTHFNGEELLNQNWLSGEHRARGGWSHLDGAIGPNQDSENRSNPDQSLFSVLSQCNELHSGAPNVSMGYGEQQFNQLGNYEGVVRGVPAPANILTQTVYPVNYLSGHEAIAAVKNNNMGWMSLPHQNPALEDSMGKPFLRSWNQ